jgi:hypothetical protein
VQRQLPAGEFYDPPACGVVLSNEWRLLQFPNFNVAGEISTPNCSHQITTLP